MASMTGRGMGMAKALFGEKRGEFTGAGVEASKAALF